MDTDLERALLDEVRDLRRENRELKEQLAKWKRPDILWAIPTVGTVEPDGTVKRNTTLERG